MQNIIYMIDTDTNVQIDPASLIIDGSVITSVADTEGTIYAGSDVQMFTPANLIVVPDLDRTLTVGDEIYLDNQSRERWTVRQGWYEVDGNPAIYGWYLESQPVGRVRSLYLKDLNSITFVTPAVSFQGIDEVEGG